MKTDNYIIKSLIVVTIIAFIFIILTSYFVWDCSQIRKELVSAQEQLKITQEDLYTYKEAYEEALANAQYEYEVNELLEMDLAEAEETIYNLKNEEYEFVYMGDFKITYYCNELYEHICGGSGVTASGKETVVGVTAAADWSVLPKGSKIYIEGIGFREVQDVGGGVKGNHIDVLVETHDDAISRGVNVDGVWVLIKKNS